VSSLPLELPDIQLAGIAPEIVLAGIALFLLVFDAMLGERFGERGLHLPVITTLGFVAAIVVAQRQWVDIGDSGPELQLAGMVAVDRFALFVKVALSGFGLLTVWLGREYLRRDRLEESEFYALLMFAVAGMMLMAASADLMVMFIALETFSLALYVMVGFRRRSLVSQESAMKYFLLGAFSSAFFLLGIALAYGAMGSTNLYGAVGDGAGIVSFLQTQPVSEVGLLVAAIGFMIVGLGFKVAVVPFHMWTPDAYQGAPSPVTGFMAAATKLAAFAAIIRLLDVSLFQLRDGWRPLLVGLAILTMIAGAVLAVMQEDVKRMLAYSSIAHAGFVLTGIVAANDDGVSGTLFYLAVYGITILGAFALVGTVGGPNERAVRLTDYKGLFYRRPALAAAMTIFLLSLAGVPLTSGFVAKLVVFGAAIEAGYAWLVVIGMVSSAIAAFFYLRILVVMYMQEPEESSTEEVSMPVANATVGLAAAATVVLGLFWGPLYDVVRSATVFFAGS
jgi:NADH-quinone oxidoreductase subunit N